ncbi:S-adenosyl-L-methionine-dependent tRNA 4-demethylwyosine synthase TYW1 [Halyomorpha halys]|uniref:S-adenosyl-L-methionine-dependent tRNA 4-demethylwyosine synthase TYW1 n=1 Tax=Halyomorpha halys TaxID=286706 RepID=UPI0006D52154|nr:S-adenosyl-L-methionine-dependent tRNA 4-demethylwyosine synthase-like [Halyomorpha halys]
MFNLDIDHSLLTIENLVFTFSFGFISMLIFRYFRVYRHYHEESRFHNIAPSFSLSNENRSNLQNGFLNVRDNKFEEVNRRVGIKDILGFSINKDEIKTVKVFYATQFGHTEELVKELKELLSENLPCSVVELSSLDPEEVFAVKKPKETALVFVIPTVNEGLPPDNATWFCKWLSEASTDFRIDKNSFSYLRYSVFGSGNSAYEGHFNTVAVDLDSDLEKLGLRRMLPLYLGDENSSNSKHGGLDEDFLFWSKLLLNAIELPVSPLNLSQDVKNITLIESSDEEEDEVMDVEDLVKPVKAVAEKNVSNGIKEMITPPLRQVLTKQGYKLIGSHSGVKLCRWTKAMLRGRGGCYKHTFYGIESHRCMEATPSLACANKCVFCWRHHSNPVGTEWKWKMDDAKSIVEGALENHYKMIKQFKGVPGVIKEKFEEGLSARHCALSLVGEPIMYPEINKLVSLLHEKHISTFMVTNAQFPDAIKNLDPVTQLYVSVDASTKDSLKKIDRPLFPDFWERFIDSLKALSEKGQRTVYRLTLVKAWNFDEMKNYAGLVDLGKPDFIEIKGVTYCGGDSKKPSKLTMENVPWHEEVISFSQQLVDLLPDYSISSEHEHSNCVLIAHKKFYIENKWNTWINYEKFHQLMEEYYKSEGKSTFSSLDYVCPTPDWAVFGARERGFDPRETRWFRKNNKDISGC